VPLAVIMQYIRILWMSVETQKEVLIKLTYWTMSRLERNRYNVTQGWTTSRHAGWPHINSVSNARSSMPDYIGKFTGEYSILHTADGFVMLCYRRIRKKNQTEEQLATETVRRHRETRTDTP
jgi:hypothetical protein